MLARLKKLIPSPQALRDNRWLRWLGPWLQHPRLWHMSRRGIATGMAIGVFFGLLIPVAQIPFSAAVAVAMRANLPVAAASTLVTNPFTFAPIYYGAYQLGKWVLGQDQLSQEEFNRILEKKKQEEVATSDLGLWDRLEYAWDRMGSVGKPLVTGLAIVSTLAGLLSYLLVHIIWVLRVRYQRRRRVKAGQSGKTGKRP